MTPIPYQQFDIVQVRYSGLAMVISESPFGYAKDTPGYLVLPLDKSSAVGRKVFEAELAFVYRPNMSVPAPYGWRWKSIVKSNIRRLWAHIGNICWHLFAWRVTIIRPSKDVYIIRRFKL